MQNPVVPHATALKKILIANRGAIAVRIIRTLKTMGMASVAVYAQDDAEAPHVRLADEAWPLGDGPVADTYLNQDRLLQILAQSGAQAVHPGYGFLSENADFCARLEAQGIAFIGPTPDQIRAFGLKHRARQLAAEHRVPLVPGSGLLDSGEQAEAEAQRMGYPVMLKSSAGGGGIGMQLCRDPEQLRGAWHSIRRLSENHFGDGALFVEKAIETARHVEVQAFGDGRGQVLILGDRDCSSQRRHQKVIEEAPAPRLPDALRSAMQQAAQQLLSAVHYRGAGTVEFIVDDRAGTFYFLEVNTRLQVEHGVTELVYGVDLVAWMVQLAASCLPPLASLASRLQPRGCAIQARLYAENPARDFQPSAGRLNAVHWPEADGQQVRIDHWIEPGLVVSSRFDPMLAKIMTHAPTRDQALMRLQTVLSETRVEGIETNRDYLCAILASDAFVQVQVHTRFLNTFSYRPPTCDVLSPGTLTTVQDYPGRLGYWGVGVPPSGPFDDCAFRLGNRLLGNPESAAGLEITLNGPTLRFNSPQRLVLTGAALAATLDGEPLSGYRVFTLAAGQVLKLGKIAGPGARAYCLFSGGLDCAEYLGARATFTLGQFGGFTGGALRTGDVLRFLPLPQAVQNPVAIAANARAMTPPTWTSDWTLRVVYGPHGAPDFFTEAGVATFFGSEWQVHYNSSRTGIRLIGPKPDWARSDGGEAGMHPSNIHDNAYALGSIDFTGDMPVILGPDGPSLGGFVCPAVVIAADHWKLGQLRAGDRVRFCPVSIERAVALYQAQAQAIAEGIVPHLLDSEDAAKTDVTHASLPSPVIAQQRAADPWRQIAYRVAGERNLLVEYGPMALDLRSRFRVHALMLWLQAQQGDNPQLAQGIEDLTPGVRSLQIHYNPQVLSLSDLMQCLHDAERQLDDAEDLEVPSRIVHLPLSWDDDTCRQATEKYTQSVRENAPWCPDNIEFIRRINGLDTLEDVKNIVFQARYVVMGLGDVYLGAPLATPLDPRHRLVTTKYNPARTWTAENAVGIGGAYLCVYGMEGPGGYQLIGRTLQMWNRHRKTHAFTQPWLLRFFDQIQFHPVSAEELLRIRRDFPLGTYPLRIEETRFSLAEYQKFLTRESDSIDDFTRRRQAAFDRELQHWIASGQIHFNSAPAHPVTADDASEWPGHRVESPVSGNLWQWQVQPGQTVAEGDRLCIVESMKMEIDITAPHSGTVHRLACPQGQPVQAGQVLLSLV